MPFAQVKAIAPARMNLNHIQRQILSEMREEGKEQAAELRRKVSDWKGEKPNFESSVGFQGDSAVVTTVATGNKKGINKFRWLDKGTRIRWAIIINGRAVIRGRRAMQRRNIKARPGIKARNWTSDLQRSRRPKFIRRMEAVNRKANNNLYA